MFYERLIMIHKCSWTFIGDEVLQICQSLIKALETFFLYFLNAVADRWAIYQT